VIDWEALLERHPGSNRGGRADARGRVITLGKAKQWRRIIARLGHEIDGAEARQLYAYLTGDDPALVDPAPAIVEDKVEIVSKPGGAVEILAKGMIRTLPQLLAAAEVDPKRWHVEEWKANTWASAMKGKDGDPVVVRLWQVKARLLPRVLPARPVQPTTSLPRRKPTVRRARDVAMFIPDTQHGFRWSPGHHKLRPMHDRAACDLAIQAAQMLRPTVIYLLGDHLDLAEMSTKFPRPPEHIETTEPAVRELYWFLAQLRQAVPEGNIVYLEGNHDARIRKLLEEKTPGLSRLRPVEDPDGEPVLAIPRLLALDSLDIEYVGPYGAEAWWGDDCRITHGDIVRSGGGKTTAAVVASAQQHTVFGHVHRSSIANRTVHGRNGPRTITAMSPGCLTKLTAGEVPAAKHSGQDWQQSIGYGVRHDGRTMLSMLPIDRGVMLLPDGTVLTGDPRHEEIAEAIGYPQAGR
jgi:hypothetical protein